MAFVKEYNARTASMEGTIVPVELTIYEDRSFNFATKTPPASELIRKAAGLANGSAEPLHEKIGQVSRTSIREIAELKMKDLNTRSLEGAMRIIEGSARSMGIEVTG